MKILIDTNILIQLEDNKIIEKEFSKFYNLAISNDCKILYHPNAIPKDIERDKNTERKNVILSKLEKYQKLENFAKPTEEFLENIKDQKINDKIDNRQLFQLYKGYVDYFVTQDNGIHSKSMKYNITDKVLTVKDALELLEKQFIIEIPQHPILREHSIRHIEKYFDSDFFDSLRNDYEADKFNNWLNKCVKEDRKCYSLIVDDKLQALLIYNSEKVEDHKIEGIFKKVLKICTLKVSYDAFGIKLGELFLNKMFAYCINHKLEHLYLTVYEKQEQLITLLEKFGFQKQVFTNSQGLSEIRMIKCLDKTKVDSTENLMVIHPFYHDGKSINKFVIPIRPEYYGSLFKDGKLRTPTLFDSAPDSVNEIQGNTIVKAYISNTRVKNFKQGDLLFFYSSKTNKVIEPIGILESATKVDNFDDLWNIVKKKTVFSQQQLSEMLQEKGWLHVITFRLITYMDKKIRLQKINEIDSFKNKLQTVTKLNEDDYLILKNEGYFDKRYIIN
jgi:arginine repressor